MDKIRSFTVVAAAVGAALVAQSAIADHGRHRGWERHGGAQREPAGRYSDTDYARVVDVEPITRRIRVTEPRRECYEETRYDEARYEDVRPRGPTPAAGSMILGGILGAAAGNQIGSGDGRRAATVAGALIGSALGHDAAARRAYRDERRYEARYYEPPRAYTVERCDVRYQESWEERIEGYRVAYEYHGRRYETRLPYDPGERVRVRVDVFPDE
jgi:uncharacterized protein YcfJ